MNAFHSSQPQCFLWHFYQGQDNSRPVGNSEQASLPGRRLHQTVNLRPIKTRCRLIFLLAPDSCQRRGVTRALTRDRPAAPGRRCPRPAVPRRGRQGAPQTAGRRAALRRGAQRRAGAGASPGRGGGNRAAPQGTAAVPARS